MLLLNIAPGDEVIMPSFTFVSTANAVVLRRGVPVFVDIDAQTLNLDPGLIEQAITPRTRAILPIHYAGVPAQMSEILAIAEKHGLAVIEDAAQAIGSTYKGRPAGSFGQLAAFSFHETKNIASGEGGCLAINDPALVHRAEIIREKGTNRSSFFRGEVDKYTWVDVGSSYLPSELIAAYLWGQLQAFPNIQAERMQYWQAYDAAFGPLKKYGLGTPNIPADCTHNAHLYYILAPTAELRNKLIQAMRTQGIYTPFHYVPLHSSPAGREFARTAGPLDITNDVSGRLLRLPLFPGLGQQQIEVIAKLTDCLHTTLAY